MSGSARRQKSPARHRQAPRRRRSISVPVGQQGRVTVSTGRSHPRTPRRPARPTVGVFVAGLAVLRRDGGTGLTVRGAFTAVELSHRRWPWQVFNDLDFN